MTGNYLTQTQELRQEQVLAPQQLQSLEILLAPLLELQEKLNQELERNPVIEQEKNAIEEPSGDPLASVERSADNDESSSKEDENDISELLQLADSWHDYLPPAHARNDYSSEDQEKREHMFNSLVEQPSLQDYLLEQLRFAAVSPKVTAVAEVVIGSIDASGYLRTHPADIAMTTETTLSKVEQAIVLVQSFDPPGIGARDLKECLLLQINRADGDTLLLELVEKHLEELGRNRLPQIARAMRVPIHKLNNIISKLKTFNPFPGSSISPEQPVFVIPEVTVTKESGEYIINANDNYLPRLRLSSRYLEMLENPETPTETKSYIKEKLLNAKMLLRSIEQRQSTIKKIARVIIDTQRDFLEQGVEYLRPLTMAQVADNLKLHETTISRAIANKYLKTPLGLFEFKFFFSGGYQSESGEAVSSRSIKEKIKELIANDDNAKPLSDSKISQILKDEGLAVARRTVAKYREESGIPASNLRKQYSG